MSADRSRQTPADVAPGPVARLLLLLVRGYQLVVSPWIAPRCRFYPSCSTYAVTALRRHGALRGSWLAVRRLGRCHPWNPGGVDHVPASKGSASGPPRSDAPTPAEAATPTNSSSRATAGDDRSADGHPTAA
jgi:uncharacterized protein